VPSVFIVNDSGHDFSAARKYGELITLSRGKVNRYHITKMLRTFADLNNSAPGDFLLPSGPMIMNCIACAMFAAKHGRLNLLLFRMAENGEQYYVVRRIKIGEDDA
jgi:hypothetical protein